MAYDCFKPTEEWPLQEPYKKDLHERIQAWGERVLPMFEDLNGEEAEVKRRFFDHLMTSVVRGDKLTADIVGTADSHAREMLEGEGPFGRGGGNIDTAPGRSMCQYQFRGLLAIYQAGMEANSQAA